MVRCLDSARVASMTLDTNPALARDIAKRYQENGVWTWFDDYVWPAQESFLKITAGPRQAKGLTPTPLSYLAMERPQVPWADRPLRSLAKKIRDLLPGATPKSPPFV